MAVNSATSMGKTSVKGSFNIFWGLAASTIFSALSLIVLARVLPPEEYGLIAVVLVAPQLIIIFTDLGVNSAMIKYTAQYRVENKHTHIRRITTIAISFQLLMGCIFTAACFLLSGFLAVTVFQRPAVEPLIQLASFTVLAGAIATSVQSAFIGHERMELYSVVQILLAVAKGVLALVLVLAGFGVFGAILGTSMAYVASAAASVGLYYFAIHRHTSKGIPEELKGASSMKMMLRYGLPLSGSAILGGFLLQLYTFILAIYTPDASMGNYNAAMSFTVFLTFFITPVSTVLFPLFSKIDPVQESENLKKAYRFSVKYGALFIAPVSAALLALAEPIIATVFGQKYVEAPLYLALSVMVMYVYSVFGSMTLQSLLNGLGKTKVTLYLTIASFAVGLPLSLVLIPRFGVVGLIATTLAAGAPDVLLGLWWIRRHYGLSIDWASSTKIFLSSAFSAAVTFLTMSQLALPSWLELFAGALLFLAMYIVVTPLIGSISKSDARNLRQMLLGLGFVSVLLGIPLSIIEKLCRKE
jgi:stage V sporulation protein B